MIAEPLMIIYLQSRKQSVFPRNNIAGDLILAALKWSKQRFEQVFSDGDQPAAKSQDKT